MAKLQITSFDGLSITIEGESPDLDGQALETAAILEIIKHVDTGRWENEDVEAGHAFYAAVLGAVARHYAVDDPVSRERPAYALLQDLIEDLRSSSRLHEIITTGAEE